MPDIALQTHQRPKHKILFRRAVQRSAGKCERAAGDRRQYFEDVAPVHRHHGRGDVVVAIWPGVAYVQSYIDFCVWEKQHNVCRYGTVLRSYEKMSISLHL
jgi:hypothetical protein